jgi:hypothetical protein
MATTAPNKHAYTMDHQGELAYKQVKRWQRTNKHAYTKDYQRELAYKQVKRWQRPLIASMLTPRIIKGSWLTSR